MPQFSEGIGLDSLTANAESSHERKTRMEKEVLESRKKLEEACTQLTDVSKSGDLLSIRQALTRLTDCAWYASNWLEYDFNGTLNKARSAFPDIAQEVIDEIVVLLRTCPNEYVRAEAGFALAEVAGATALPELINSVTSDPSEKVRWNSLRALGKIRSEAVLPVFFQVLKSESDSLVLHEALYELGWLLMEVWESADPEDQHIAADIMKAADEFAAHSPHATGLHRICAEQICKKPSELAAWYRNAERELEAWNQQEREKVRQRVSSPQPTQG